MALADLDPSESSLGSWADECERADAALAATEAQLGRTGDRPEMDAALAAAESWMEKEDRELLAALEAAMATLHPHPPPPPNRSQRTGLPARGRWADRSVRCRCRAAPTGVGRED